ncbi:MAG: hypothetical protein RLZZ04_662 [Cyanobacteriota bacterium]|jgi:Rad3-related DNA helicase
MSNLDQILDEAMNLPLEQREILIQILQRRMIEQRREEIAQDAKLSLAEFREGKLRIQTVTEAISELTNFIASSESFSWTR